MKSNHCIAFCKNIDILLGVNASIKAVKNDL